MSRFPERCLRGGMVASNVAPRPPEGGPKSLNTSSSPYRDLGGAVGSSWVGRFSTERPGAGRPGMDGTSAGVGAGIGGAGRGGGARGNKPPAGAGEEGDDVGTPAGEAAG